ncbi:hypothetical protein evm_014464, partial [Chilo suppressalis]
MASPLPLRRPQWPSAKSSLIEDLSLDTSVRNCVNSQCNTICRFLGFARGVCISANVCECYRQFAFDGINDVEPASLDDVNMAKSNPVEDISLDTSPRSCVNSQCNAFCRRRGYARGVCAGPNVCRCYRRFAFDGINDVEPASLDDVTLVKSNPVEDISLDTSLRSCVNSQCHAFCRRRGFARGVCVGPNVCRCYRRFAFDSITDVEPAFLDDVTLAKINPVEDISLEKSLRSCVNSQCNALCRRLGFARGVCISANVCRCSGRLTSDATFDEITLDINNPSEDVSLETSLRSCVNSQCNAVCRRLGFARGVCVSANVCRCSGRLAFDATLNEVEPDAIEVNEINADSEPTADHESNDIPQNNE